MASFASAISDFFSAIFSVISGILNTIFAAIQSVFQVVQAFVSSLFELAGGIIGFILGNIAVIAFIAAAVGIYIMITRRSGGKPIAGKKKS